MHEDNESAIEMMNASKPTGQSQHADIQFFAMRDWKDEGDVTVQCIPGVIKPANNPKPLGWPLGCALHNGHV